MDRRTFIKYSLATGVLIWAGGTIPRWLGLDQAEAQALFAVDPQRSASELFPQSVASGDPQPHGITLWTRVASTTETVKVAFEIASDTTFTKPVLRGVVSTDASKDYVVKTSIDSRKLKPFQTYYYRFICDRTASRAGRFKTLPEPNANLDRIRFAYVSCQDYTNGYYTALNFLAQEDVDFVVHLGDYIYETVGEPGPENPQVRSLRLPSGKPQAETLDDYRFLYKTYKSDKNLQLVHEQFAFIAIWDDHEFANDAYQQSSPQSTDESQNLLPQLRQAANQAWAEYMPVSLTFDATQDPLNSLQIYRSFAFGNLMELVMTDERLYRDGPPCGLEVSQRYLTPGCSAQSDPQRTMLGSTQRQWFLDTLTRSPRIWKIWGNEVMVMQLKVLHGYLQKLLPQAPSVDLFVGLDSWDGYQAERTALLRQIQAAGVKNLVTITGDIHTFIAGYQKLNFDNAIAPPVGVCFVCGSITSSNFAEVASAGSFSGFPIPRGTDVGKVLHASNPHIQYLNAATHGYNIIEVTSHCLTCTMKAVSTITAPQANLETLKVFRVPRDQTLIQDLTESTSTKI